MFCGFILMAEPVAVLSRALVLRSMIAIFMTSAVYFLSVLVIKLPVYNAEKFL